MIIIIMSMQNSDNSCKIVYQWKTLSTLSILIRFASRERKRKRRPILQIPLSFFTLQLMTICNCLLVLEICVYFWFKFGSCSDFGKTVAYFATTKIIRCRARDAKRIIHIFFNCILSKNYHRPPITLLSKRSLSLNEICRK